MLSLYEKPCVASRTLYLVMFPHNIYLYPIELTFSGVWTVGPENSRLVRKPILLGFLTFMYVVNVYFIMIP